MYLYLAVDLKGNTSDFYLSKIRDRQAAKRFFKKAQQFFYVLKLCIIKVVKNPSYSIAIEQLKKEKAYLVVCELDNKVLE